MFDYTSFVFGLFAGIAFYFLAIAGADWFRTRKALEKERRDTEWYQERHEKEMAGDIEHLAWMLTSGFPREELYTLLENEIWGEDRENLQFMMDFVASHLKSREFSELITLKRYDPDFKTLYIAILPSAVPDMDRRRRLSQDIEHDITKYIQDTYGFMGEVSLNVLFDFVVLDDQLNEVRPIYNKND